MTTLIDWTREQKQVVHDVMRKENLQINPFGPMTSDELDELYDAINMHWDCTFDEDGEPYGHCLIVEAIIDLLVSASDNLESAAAS